MLTEFYINTVTFTKVKINLGQKLRKTLISWQDHIKAEEVF